MYRFLLFLFLVFSLVEITAQSSIAEKMDAELSYLTEEAQPGCALGIIQKGKTLLTQGYGLANLEHQIPFVPETVSDIGSVSKQMTCLGIVLLAQQGKLALDDPIIKYFPNIPDFGNRITIQHLIYHTSGLREIYGTQGISGLRSGDAIYQEDALQLAHVSTALNFEPGSSYSYCNTGYMLLADIIRKVSGQLFENWMRENIFLPLGMKDTHIMDKPGEVFPEAAASYAAVGKTYKHVFDNSTVQGAGGVYSTIPDLLRWIDNYRTKKVGGQAAYDQMITGGKTNSGFPLYYAFGLRLDDYAGISAISHTGSSAGYRTIMFYLPEQEFGFVMKTNQTDIDRTKVRNLVLGHYFLNEQEVKKIGEEIKIEPPLSLPPVVDNFQEYAGQYFCPELATSYSLIVEEQVLFATHFRLGKTNLVPKAKDQFTAERWYLSNVKFERNKENKIIGMYMDGDGVKKLWFKKQ